MSEYDACMDQKPSDALTRRPHTLRNALIGVAAVAVVATGGIGAYALTTADQSVQRVEAEPTPTVEETVEIAADSNEAPTAYYVVSSVSGLTVGFDGSGSTDPDGSLTSYDWDFGDGTTGAGATVSHVYSAGGSYSVTLTVSDGELTHTFTAVIDVAAPASPGSGGYTYGNYPPGAVMPNITGTDAPDTSACASSTGTTNAQGQNVCA